MIQRIQTLFLLIVSASFFVLFAFPFATTSMAGTRTLADQDFDILDNPILLTIAILGGLLALVNIFLFRNRKRQIHIGYLLIVLGILIAVAAYILFMQDAQTLPSEAVIQDALGAYLPFIVIVFTIIANYFIRKDEKTVRSMDRLR